MIDFINTQHSQESHYGCHGNHILKNRIMGCHGNYMFLHIKISLFVGPFFFFHV